MSIHAVGYLQQLIKRWFESIQREHITLWLTYGRVQYPVKLNAIIIAFNNIK
jgi:hypothetical protein